MIATLLASVMIMVFVMGSPWMQKFTGECSEAKLGEWKLHIETMLSFQPLTDLQKEDFVLGPLEGEAKREILALERGCRDTPKKIFDVLLRLYGDNTHASILRTQFFNCRQEPQALRSFSLRL